MPKGTSLRIVIKGDRIWSTTNNYSPQTINWLVSPYDTDAKSQEFVVKESNKETDLFFVINTATIFTNISIEYYENGALTPTRVKTLVVGSPLQYIYPNTGDYGPNVLSNNFAKFMTGDSNSMRAEISSGGTLTIILNGGGTWIIEGKVTNWTVEGFNVGKQWQVFKVTESAKASDLPIIFTAPGTYKIDYYENTDIVPTRTKLITIV